MSKILRFTAKSPAKFGFERARRRKSTSSDGASQLNLFTLAGKILNLPRTGSLFEEALMFDERGDQRAEKSYWKAINEGDSIADAYCNLGIFESERGRTARAFDCFTLSLKNDPRHFESHYNLGNLYFEAGDLRLARTHYELAIEIQPAFPNVYFNLGLVHAVTENYGAAVDALTKYKELAPQSEGRIADDLLATLRRSTRRKK